MCAPAVPGCIILSAAYVIKKEEHPNPARSDRHRNTAAIMLIFQLLKRDELVLAQKKYSLGG